MRLVDERSNSARRTSPYCIAIENGELGIDTLHDSDKDTSRHRVSPEVTVNMYTQSLMY